MNPLTASIEYTHDNKLAIIQKKPSLSFCCKTIGMNCSHEIRGSTAQELMKKFIDHAETAHNMQVLAADVILRVQNAIKK